MAAVNPRALRMALSHLMEQASSAEDEGIKRRFGPKAPAACEVCGGRGGKCAKCGAGGDEGEAELLDEVLSKE